MQPINYKSNKILSKRIKSDIYCYLKFKRGVAIIISPAICTYYAGVV